MTMEGTVALNRLAGREHLALEVRCRGPLAQLRILIAPHLGDDPSALHRRAGGDFLNPARNVGVFVDREEGLPLGSQCLEQQEWV